MRVTRTCGRGQGRQVIRAELTPRRAWGLRPGQLIAGAYQQTLTPRQNWTSTPPGTSAAAPGVRQALPAQLAGRPQASEHRSRLSGSCRGRSMQWGAVASTSFCKPPRCPRTAALQELDQHREFRLLFDAIPQPAHITASAQLNKHMGAADNALWSGLDCFQPDPADQLKPAAVRREPVVHRYRTTEEGRRATSNRAERRQPGHFFGTLPSFGRNGRHQFGPNLSTTSGSGNW